MKLLVSVGVTVGSYAGWNLGEGFGVLAAFVISGVGSVAGVYLGWRAARALHLE